MGRASRKKSASTLRRQPQKSTPQIRRANFGKLEKEKLHVLYIENDQDVKNIAQSIQDLGPSAIGLDFETASKNGKYGVENGALRLIQIGIEEPGIAPTQIVVDCFRASPRPLLSIFRDPQIEKQIHNMSFEQEWSQIQLGARIQNVYDTCIAFRVIQNHLRSLDDEKVQTLLPGYHQHDNKLATLLKIYLNMEMPKEGQSSDWSREKLLPEQVKYAAMDAAVMPLITEQVKKIADHVGCTKEIEDKLNDEDRKINLRIRKKKKTGEDDSIRIERALARAASEKELNRLWESRSQMTIFSDNAVRLRATYSKRKLELPHRK